ncbi:MAG: hypothetical protein WC601_03590 [Desulfotomaculaceae bacterium]
MKNRYTPDNLTTLVAVGLLLFAIGGDATGMLAFSGIALMVAVLSYHKNKKTEVPYWRQPWDVSTL